MRITVVKGEPALAFTVGGRRLLVVADLHLGLEDELAAKGVNIPGLSTRITRQLMDLVDRVDPEELVILGDLKHGVGPPSRSTQLVIEELVSDLSQRGVEITLVKGNHDGGIEDYLPSHVRIVGPRGFRIGEVGLMHGHSWPAEEVLMAELILAGHIHPAARVIDPNTGRMRAVRVWVISSPEEGESARTRDIAGARIVLMPAYNWFVGSGIINSVDPQRNLGPLSRLISDHGVVHVLAPDGTYLGTLRDLREGQEKG